MSAPTTRATPPPASPPQSAEAPPDLPPTPRGTVLVVEDHPDMRRFIAELLSTDHDVTTASDGEEGLERALELQPDLIVSDVMMPRLSGEQLVASLRDHPELASTPVLVLTARNDPELRIRLLREGAHDFVSKPFHPDEIRARAGNLVRTKRARDILQEELETTHAGVDVLSQAIADRKRDLESALETVRDARDEARRASRAKTDFLDLVSHELRTPLTSIRLYLELFRRTSAALEPRQQKLLEQVGGSTGRLTHLVDALLDYSRIESGRLQIAAVPTDVASLAREVVEEQRALASGKGVVLELDAPEALSLTTDARLVRLVLDSLVGNAVKFTDAGRVVVAVAQDSDGVQVRVTDTGPGIPADQLQRIFEPFEHGEQVRHKHTPGFGLGLTLAREVVRALGGTLGVTSAPGEGATFSTRLPALPVKSDTPTV